MFWLVVAAGAAPALRRAFSARWLVALGAVSYGMYLVHEPIVAMIERAMPPSLGGVPAFAAALAGALLSGVAFSLLAERPFVRSRLRDRLVASLESPLRQAGERLGLSDDLEVRRRMLVPERALSA
jgi:peptidoglycan/LPS O-acetylase OafA/YrhL